MTRPSSLLIFLLSTALIVCSCSATKTLSDGKKIDKRLIGAWQGSETNLQLEGLEKKWEMERYDNGTFSLNFQTIKNRDTVEFTENGEWWVEGNTFFEYHEESRKTDTYKYTLLNEKQVKFEMLSSDFEFEDPTYTFIDTKISELKPIRSNRDGLSLETAIKVNSITEEYQYVREHCQNCEVLSQALLNHEGKPYDKLNLMNPNGKKISYYFDISSFFGK